MQQTLKLAPFGTVPLSSPKVIDTFRYPAPKSTLWQNDLPFSYTLPTFVEFKNSPGMK